MKSMMHIIWERLAESQTLVTARYKTSISRFCYLTTILIYQNIYSVQVSEIVYIKCIMEYQVHNSMPITNQVTIYINPLA